MNTAPTDLDHTSVSHQDLWVLLSSSVQHASPNAHKVNDMSLCLVSRTLLSLTSLLSRQDGTRDQSLEEGPQGHLQGDARGR